MATQIKSPPCGRTEEQIFDYAVDLAEGKDNAEIRVHVNSCPRCKKMLDGFQEIGRSLEKLGAASDPGSSSNQQTLVAGAARTDRQKVAAFGKQVAISEPWTEKFGSRRDLISVRWSYSGVGLGDRIAI